MRGPQCTFFEAYVIGDVKGWRQSSEAEGSERSQKPHCTNKQIEKPRYTNKVLDYDDTNSDTQSVQSAKYYHENQVQLHRSTRQQFTYHSFQEESKCIICTEVKEDNHGKVILVQTMTFRSKDDKEHLAEKAIKTICSNSYWKLYQISRCWKQNSIEFFNQQ